ncbi:MAG: HEAT repeat domain-containing protein [Fimbriimonadales bacterium]
MTYFACILAAAVPLATTNSDEARIERLIASLGPSSIGSDGGLNERIEDTLARLIRKSTPGVERLIVEINSKDFERRTRVISALSRIGDARAKEPLYAVFRQNPRDSAAIRALGVLGERRIAPKLIERVLMMPQESQVEIEALRALGDPTAEEAYRAALRTKTVAIPGCLAPGIFSEPFRPAALGIAELGDAESVLKELSASSDWRDRRGSAIGLVKGAESFALPTLRKLARDKQAEVRGEALVTLGIRRDADALPLFYEGLGDKDVRGKALEGLSYLADPQMVHVVMALKDEEPDLVARVLCGTDSDEASVAHKGLILDRNDRVAAAAINALSSNIIRHELAVFALETRPDHAYAAATVLARFSALGISQLSAFAGSSDSRIGTAVALALQMTNDEVAIPILRSMLRDTNKEVAEMARYALERLLITLGLLAPRF